MAGKTRTPPDPTPRIVPTFRVGRATWQAFLEATGNGRASSILRRLAVLYATDERLRARVERTPDPSPDLRHAGTS